MRKTHPLRFKSKYTIRLVRFWSQHSVKWLHGNQKTKQRRKKTKNDRLKFERDDKIGWRYVLQKWLSATLEKCVISNMAFGGNWIDAISVEHNLFQFFPPLSQSNGLKFCCCRFPQPSCTSRRDDRDDCSLSLSALLSGSLLHVAFSPFICSLRLLVRLAYERRKRCRKLLHLFSFPSVCVCCLVGNHFFSSSHFHFDIIRNWVRLAKL